MMHRVGVAAGLLGLLAPVALACGGSSLPTAAECVEPTPIPRADSASLGLLVYERVVLDGETQLAMLLEQLRATYPDRLFYRSEKFRADWVAYAGAATCVIDDIDALALPNGAEPAEEAREVELESILAEYRRVLERGGNAVRQRNTSDYRDFHRNVDAVAGRLQSWVDQGLD